MQLSLFPQNNIEDTLFAGCRLLFHPSFVSDTEAARYFQQIWNETAWEQSEIQIFGRRCLIPRLNAWYGEKSYAYSGNKMEAFKMTNILEEIRAKVEKKAGVQFNSVLLNLYRDGEDTVGWHADDEPELDHSAPIASLSLGTARRFVLREKLSKQEARAPEKKELTLGHGDLVIMYPPAQQLTEHTLPRMKRVTEPRINLTFRRIL